jgi:hypothetical protein
MNRLLLGAALALALAVVPLRAVELGANIVVSEPGLIGTATLAGASPSPFVNITVQSPGPGNIAVDIYECTSGAACGTFPDTTNWTVYTTFGFDADMVRTLRFGARLLVNTSQTKFMAVVRSVSGGTWSVVSVDVTS